MAGSIRLRSSDQDIINEARVTESHCDGGQGGALNTIHRLQCVGVAEGKIIDLRQRVGFNHLPHTLKDDRGVPFTTLDLFF